MGNFKAILEVIERDLGKELKNKVSTIYKNEENYRKFSNELREEISRLKNKHDIAFYYIVPDFNTFYNSKINYHDSV